MRLTPSGSAITREVLVALRAFEVSVELSVFAVPVNVFEVAVALELTAAGAAVVFAAEPFTDVGVAGAATGTATGIALIGAGAGAGAAVGNCATLSGSTAAGAGSLS
jgi:hypothetical protein